MDITKSREEFHKWLEGVHGLYGEDIDWQPERSCYRIFGIHLAWCAWQASRESIEIELPTAINAGEIGPAISKERIMARLAYAGIRIRGESE